MVTKKGGNGGPRHVEIEAYALRANPINSTRGNAQAKVEDRGLKRSARGKNHRGRVKTDRGQKSARRPTMKMVTLSW